MNLGSILRVLLTLVIDTQGDKLSYSATVKACEESLGQIDIIAPNLKWSDVDLAKALFTCFDRGRVTWLIAL